MNKIIPIISAIALLAMLSHAGIPIQNMSPNSFSLDYSGLWRGETITLKEVGAHENIQMFSIHYAPVPYLLLSAGAGIASYTVDTNRSDAVHKVYYKGEFGFAPSFGINAFTPYLVGKILRFTAGARGYYLNTSDEAEQCSYAGLFATGGAGAIFSIGSAVDIEVGGRGFIIMGEMQEKGDPTYSFSNNQNVRGYISVTLQTPLEGGYIVFDFDASPNISGDWRKGPSESSIGITAGMVLRSRASVEKSKSVNDKNFPNFNDLQKKLDTLQKELK